MVFTDYVKRRIIYHHIRGLRPPTIAKLLLEEKIWVTRAGIAKFVKQYNKTKSFRRKKGSGRLSKISEEMKEVIDEELEKNDQMSSCQLHQLLVSKGYDISVATVRRYRNSLGGAGGSNDTPTTSDGTSDEELMQLDGHGEVTPTDPSQSDETQSLDPIPPPSSRHTNGGTTSRRHNKSGPTPLERSVSELKETAQQVLLIQNKILENQQLIFGRICNLELKFMNLEPISSHTVASIPTASPHSLFTMGPSSSKLYTVREDPSAATRLPSTPRPSVTLHAPITSSLQSSAVTPRGPVVPLIPITRQPFVVSQPAIVLQSGAVTPRSSSTPQPPGATSQLSDATQSSSPSTVGPLVAPVVFPDKMHSKSMLDSSEIDKDNLLPVEVVIAKYPKLKSVDKASSLAVKLAREAIFGDDLLIKCTVTGARGYPGLPRDTLAEMKQLMFSQYPEFWNEPASFEPVWTSCTNAISQCSKRLRNLANAVTS